MKKWLLISATAAALFVGYLYSTDREQADFSNEKEVASPPETARETTLPEPRPPAVAVKSPPKAAKQLPAALPERFLELANPIERDRSSCKRPKLSNEKQVVEQAADMIVEGTDTRAVYALLHHLDDFRISRPVRRAVRGRGRPDMPRNYERSVSYGRQIEHVESSLELLNIIETIPAADRPLISRRLAFKPNRISDFSERDVEQLLASGVVRDVGNLVDIGLASAFTDIHDEMPAKLISKLQQLPDTQPVNRVEKELLYTTIAVYSDIDLAQAFMEYGIDFDDLSDEANLADRLLLAPLQLRERGGSANTHLRQPDQAGLVKVLNWLADQDIHPSRTTVERLRDADRSYWPEDGYLDQIAKYREDTIPDLYSHATLSVLNQLNIDISEVEQLPEKERLYQECREKRRVDYQEKRAQRQALEQEFHQWVDQQRALGFSEDAIEERLAEASTRLIRTKRRLDANEQQSQSQFSPTTASTNMRAHTATVDRFEEALANNEISIDTVNNLFSFPLVHQAVRAKNTEQLQRLLSLGVSTKHIKRPLSRFFRSRNFDDFEFLDFLYANGVTFDKASFEHRQPFFSAIRADNLALAEYLAARNAPLGDERFLEDALMYSLKRYRPNRPETLNYLIEIGFPVHEQHRKLHSEIKASYEELPPLPEPQE